VVTLNHVSINCKKTKEMALGSFIKELLVPLTVASMTVECVPVYVLHGVAINLALKWDDHVAAINLMQQNIFGFSRNSSMLVFQLTTSYIITKPSSDHCWNTSVLCGTPVSQKNKHSQSLEKVRHCAIQIIVGMILRVEHQEYCY